MWAACPSLGECRYKPFEAGASPGHSDANLFRYCQGVNASTDQRPLRAVRVAPIAVPPLLVCPNQRTYSDTVQVENELRVGAYLHLSRAAARAIVVRSLWLGQPGINPIRDLFGEIRMARHRDIPIFYAMARMANDVRLALARSFTPDFAVHARRLLAALGQTHKIYDSEPPCLLSQEPAAEDELRAHDRHVVATFRSAHCHC
jgi:hypothetical protein